MVYGDFQRGIQRSPTLIHPVGSPPKPTILVDFNAQWKWLATFPEHNTLCGVTQAIAQFTRIQYAVTFSGTREKGSWMQSAQWVDIPLDALGLLQNLGRSFQNGLGNTPLGDTAQLKTTVIIVLCRLAQCFFVVVGGQKSQPTPKQFTTTTLFLNGLLKDGRY